MNQDTNNLNQNNINIQDNNGMPNNQPLQKNLGLNPTFNQNVASNTNVNQTTFNYQPTVETVQPQPMVNCEQSITQHEIASQTISHVESGNLGSEIKNSSKGNSSKKNILIIVIILICLIVLSVIAIFAFKPSNKSDEVILKNAKYEYKTFLYGTKYNEYLYSVAGTNDNGFVSVGTSEFNNGSSSMTNTEYSDAVIIKYNSSNQIEWEKFYSSESKYASDIFTDVKITDNDEYIVAAKINGKNNRGHILYDAAILKYDKNGNLLWKKILEGNKEDVYEKVYVLSSGDFLVVGFSNSSNLNNIKNYGGEDAIISKYDKSGNLLWIKNYGGENNDSFKSVIESSDGSIIVVGQSDQKHFNGYYDAIIIKYDKDGNLVWEKNYGGSRNDRFIDVTITDDNEIIAVGNSNSKDIENIDFNGDNLAIAIKYDLDGNYKKMYTYGTRFVNSFECIINYNGKYLLSGYTYVENRTDSESMFIEIDDDLNMISEKIISGTLDDYIYGISTMKDTGFISVGKSYSSFDELKNVGLGDGIIVRKQNINY